MPVVMFSYRDGAGVPRHETIWRPGVSINSCCLRDVRARDRFLSELEQRIEELRHPPLDASSGAILLDHLDWLRAAIAEKVTPVTDDERIEDLEARMQGSVPIGGHEWLAIR